MRRKSATWRWSVGEYGLRVSVREKTPGGVIKLGAPDPDGTWRWVSLGHRNKVRAKQQARELLTRLEGGAGISTDPTLGYLADLYISDHVLSMKPKTRAWVTQCLTAWKNYLGPNFRITHIGPKEWEGFTHLRKTGAIDAYGKHVDVAYRRQLKPGTVNLSLEALNMLVKWAMKWRIRGKPLLKENPLYGMPYLDNPNVTRSVWTHSRYLKVLAAAEGMTMRVTWNGKQEDVPSYLADVLVIAEGTGHRIGSVRQLRHNDLILGEQPKVRWRAGTDKAETESLTPISPEVHERLMKVRRERATGGDMPLFPAPMNRSRPVGEKTVAHWLDRAMKVAGVPALAQDKFHGLRRKWVTERKDYPDKDVARAGGWRSTRVMKQAYQQVDDATVLEVVLSPRRLKG